MQAATGKEPRPTGHTGSMTAAGEDSAQITTLAAHIEEEFLLPVFPRSVG